MLWQSNQTENCICCSCVKDIHLIAPTTNHNRSGISHSCLNPSTTSLWAALSCSCLLAHASAMVFAQALSLTSTPAAAEPEYLVGLGNICQSMAPHMGNRRDWITFCRYQVFYWSCAAF